MRSEQWETPLAQAEPGEHIFRREGEYWTIRYNGTIIRLRDTKGLRYLAHLLRHPGERFAACDLVAVADASAFQALKPSGLNSAHPTLNAPAWQ